MQSDYLIICFNLHPRHVKATYICIDFHTFTHGDVVNRFVVLVQQEPPGGSLDVLPRAKTVQSRGAQAPRITFSVLTMRLSGPTRFSRFFFFFLQNGGLHINYLIRAKKLIIELHTLHINFPAIAYWDSKWFQYKLFNSAQESIIEVSPLACQVISTRACILLHQIPNYADFAFGTVHLVTINYNLGWDR